MADADTSTDTPAVPAHTHDLEDINWPVPDGELDEHDVPPDTNGSRSGHPAAAVSAQQRSMAAVRGNTGAAHSFRQITGR